MEALLAKVHAARTVAGAAHNALSLATTAETNHIKACGQMCGDLEALRRRMVAERREPSNSVITDASQLTDMQLCLEAAESRKPEFAAQVAAARQTVEAAEAAANAAVTDFAAALENEACSKIDSLLEELVAVCVEGVAAAEVSAKHGKAIGATLGLSQHIDASHGGSGKMLSFLESTRWPEYPRAFKPKSIQRAERALNFFPPNCVGVAEHIARIEASMSVEAAA